MTRVDSEEIKEFHEEMKEFAQELEEELSDEAEFQKLQRNIDGETGTWYPRSISIQIWEFVSYLVILYEVIVIPYNLGFSRTQVKNQTI